MLSIERIICLMWMFLGLKCVAINLTYISLSISSVVKTSIYILLIGAGLLTALSIN